LSEKDLESLTVIVTVSMISGIVAAAEQAVSQGCQKLGLDASEFLAEAAALRMLMAEKAGISIL
jgi:hypothetical protein